MKIEIIQAILDGRVVQYEKCFTNQNGKVEQAWTDLDIKTNKHPTIFASLFTNDVFPKWRIKPEVKLISYRVALFKDESDYYTNTADSYEEAEELQNSIYFKKWLTDHVMFSVED